MKKQPSSIRQFSQFFQVPLLTLYLVMASLAVFIGFYVFTSSIRQEQKTEGLASSGQAQTLNCNEACGHNHQCPPNHFCFNGRCRLVTTPDDPNCGQSTQPVKGEVPVAPQPTTPPTQEVPDTLRGCNQACANNNQCPPNFFCYQGRCRLVTLPQDPTCGQETVPTATTPATQPTWPPMPTTQPATEAGVPFIPFIPEVEEEPDTGIMGMINDFLADSDTSIFFVLGIGVVGLIVLVAIVTFISSRKKVEYQPADFSGLNEASPSTQEENQTIPINPSAESAEDNAETQPTFQADDSETSQATSSMISRLKEKEVEPPTPESREPLTPEEQYPEEPPKSEDPQKQEPENEQ